MLFLKKRPKKIRSWQSRRLAKAIGDAYIFEPSENLGSSPEKNKKKESLKHFAVLMIPQWSKRRDSNPRSPVPEAIRSSILTTFVYFLVLFSPKTMLSDALVRTVSTQSKSVDGQRCGHRANSANLKARKLNRIYPVLSFFLLPLVYHT